VAALKKKKKRRVLEKIPGQLEASFLIFLTLGLIKQSNTHQNMPAGEMDRRTVGGMEGGPAARASWHAARIARGDMGPRIVRFFSFLS